MLWFSKIISFIPCFRPLHQNTPHYPHTKTMLTIIDQNEPEARLLNIHSLASAFFFFLLFSSQPRFPGPGSQHQFYRHAPETSKTPEQIKSQIVPSPPQPELGCLTNGVLRLNVVFSLVSSAPTTP